MTARRPRRFLPMVWHFARVSERESYTFRWGRGSGVITVHRGDVRGSHGEETLLCTIPVGIDWTEENDLRRQARQWLRAREQHQRARP